MKHLLRIAALATIALMTGPVHASAQAYEEAKLVVPGDGSITDEFGTSAALDGNTLIVGRRENRAGGTGSVQVFVRSGTTWTLQATIISGDNTFLFGSSVALSGNTAVVGALEAVYVFVRNGIYWNLQQRLAPSGDTYSQGFGTSVSVSGEVCVVGAPTDGASHNDRKGSTYVFTRSGAVWTPRPKLSAADGQESDRFGTAVAVHNSNVIVGAPHATVGGHAGQGAAYVFVLDGANWVQQHKLTAADGASDDWFGSSVGMFSSGVNATAAVGARFADTTPGGNQGVAYVFERKPITDAVVWDPAGKLTAATVVGSEMGRRIAVSGRTDFTGKIIDRVIAVGAPGPEGPEGKRGAAYVFNPSGPGTWAQQAFLAGSDASPDTWFGAAIAASGVTVVVGAPSEDVNLLEDEGAAYVFTRSGTVWSQEVRLTSFSGATGDQLGSSVAISGNTALVGAPYDAVGGRAQRGSAYVFVRGAEGWTQQARLLVPDGEAYELSGHAVAVSGNIAVIGAPNQEVGTSKAYVFVRAGSDWTLQATLTASNVEDKEFGISVAVSGTTILVGSRGGEGAAYVFVRDGAQWTKQQRLTDEDGVLNDAFGSSVALSGNTAAVGAPDDDVGIHLNQGSASVFVSSNGVWTQQAKVFGTPDVDVGEGEMDRFGAAVALSGRRLLVGAPRGSDAVAALPGSAYLFERAGTEWTLLQRLRAPTPSEQDAFGTSVALAGDFALVGAPAHDDQPSAAYLFTRSATSPVSTRLNPWTNAPYVDFGASVALTDRVTLVGAPMDNNDGGTWAGAAYVNRLSADFGDAPDSTFPTRYKNDGARHLLELDGLKLGATVDGEVDGQPNSGATGDDIAESDDENGVLFGTLTGATTGSVFVTVNNAVNTALLDGWIDFNRDGDWEDVGERVFRHRAVVNGSQAIDLPVPAGVASGTAIARIRLSTDGVAAPTGLAVDGEVEDLEVTLQKGVLPKLSIDDVRSAEGDDANKAFKFTVTLSAKSVSPVTVTAATADGTATAPGDYKTRSFALTIKPGQTQVQFSIPVVGDTKVEPGETFIVKLTQPSGATLADAKGVGTIVNDD